MTNEEILEFLIGKRAALDRAIEAMRHVTGEARRGRPPKAIAPPAEDYDEEPEPAAPDLHVAPRKLSKVARAKVGASSRERWATVRAAGLATGKLPTNAVLARARRILARRKSA